MPKQPLMLKPKRLKVYPITSCLAAPLVLASVRLALLQQRRTPCLREIGLGLPRNLNSCECEPGRRSAAKLLTRDERGG
jgi:hypothetical protein